MRRRLFTFCWAASLLLCVGAYLTETRAAMLALSGVLLLGSIVPVPNRRSYRGVLAGLGLAGLLLFVAGAPVIPRLDEPSSSKDRYDLLLATGEMFLAHPLAGVGYGNFDRFQVDFYNRGQHFGGLAFNKEFWDGGSHNTLLTPFAELGLFVGLLNLAFLLSRIPPGLEPVVDDRGGRRLRHPVLVCGSLMVVAFIISGFFVEFRYTATPTLLLWSFAAIVERYRWVLGEAPVVGNSGSKQVWPRAHRSQTRPHAGVS